MGIDALGHGSRVRWGEARGEEEGEGEGEESEPMLIDGKSEGWVM